MMKKRKKPTFNVLNYGAVKQVKARWRRPRGVANKKRMKESWAGASPKIGYRNPKTVRNLHPRGKPEVLVSNVSMLDQINGKEMLVRIARTVGARKRTVLLEKAKSMGLSIVNE